MMESDVVGGRKGQAGSWLRNEPRKGWMWGLAGGREGKGACGSYLDAKVDDAG